VATTLIFAGTNDNEVACTDPSYATARAATGTLSLGNVADTFISAGQRFAGQYQVFEGFLEFPYTLDTNDLKCSSVFQYVHIQNTGSAVRSLDTFYRDWGGGAVTTTDFVANNATMSSGVYVGAIQNAQSWPIGSRAKCGSIDMLSNILLANAAVRVILVTSRQRAGNTPTGDEYNKIGSSAQAGTTNDPLLLVGRVRKNTLAYVLGASAQLSDGTTVYLESDGATPPVINLKYRTTAAVVGTIGALTLGGTGWAVDLPSQQRIALTVDASDNIYVVGKKNDGVTTGNDILAKCWKKSGTLTWTGMGALSGTLPAYSGGGQPNQFVAAWHPTSGGGHLMVVGSHIAWTGRTGTMFYAVLSATSLLAGAGTLITDSAADPAWFGLATVSDYVAYPNETGSKMDLFADPSSVNRGYFISLDANNFATNGRYTLNTSGVVSLGEALIDDSMSTLHDPQGKLRVIVLTDGRYIMTNGNRVVARTPTQSLLGFADMDNTGTLPTNFPIQAVTDGLASWDAVYDPAARKIWVYYLDTVDSRILRRTSFSLDTYAATNESVIVSSTVGAVSTTNVAVRVPRGRVDERKVTVAVANIVTAGGALSTVYLDDSFNLAPNPPTLAVIAPFDATQSKVFAWTFSDPNPKDTQASYQLQIIRTSDSVSMLDTGTVASAVQQHTVPAATMANAVAYQWRVRTTDPAGNVGAYSAFQDFTTSGGGNVTITTPATDNLAGSTTSDYTIAWSTSGTVQASYRIQVIKTADGTTFSDTGFITSVATSALVQNLQSGTEYRIQVTVRNAALAVSNPGTRLITPAYTSPEAPVLSVTTQDTNVLVSIANPTPVGDEPEVAVNHLYRRLVGSVAWTYVGDVPYNGFYLDYTAGAGVAYEYYARGDSGTSGTDSAIATGVGPALQGVYLHDPDNPIGTSTQFFFAPAGKKENRQVAADMLVFAGRTRPVAEFGENQTDVLDVEFLVPFDDQWYILTTRARTIFRTFKTYAYRDNRGRTWFGVLRSIELADTPEGTRVSFSFERTDYSAVTASLPVGIVGGDE
jgi:hypothetical protein